MRLKQRRNKLNFISTYHKRVRKQRHQGVLRILKYLLLIICILIFVKLVFVGFSAAIHSKIFEISGQKNFKITGLYYLKEERIFDAINFDRETIFRINIKDIRRQVEKVLPQAEEVSVWREWPNKVMIHIKEREPAGIVVMKDGQCLGVDKNFVLFSLIDSYKYVDKPIITGIDIEQYELGRQLEDMNLLEAVTILEYINNNTTYLRSAIDVIDVSDLNKITIYLNDGSKVIALYMNNEDEQGKIDYAERSYSLYLEGQISIKKYIDVRFWSPDKKDVVIY